MTHQKLIELSEEPYLFIRDRFREGYSHIGLGEAHDNNVIHQFVVSIVPRLREDVGLKYGCLEIESDTQDDIDAYLRTGNEEFLEKIIDNERKMVKRGYPVQGRIDGNYFDILRIARELGLPVIAMDSHEDEDKRNEYMVSRVPQDGPTLVYVGAGHLMHGLFGQEFEKRHKNPNHFTVYQLTQGECSGDDREFENYIQNSQLKGKSFAFDFLNPETKKAFLQHEPWGWTTDFNINCWNGLIYHRKT